MLAVLLITLFVITFAVVWYAVLHYIRNPHTDLYFEGKVMAHEPNLEEYLNKTLVYLHEEEQANIKEIETLLGSVETAESVVKLLLDRNQINALTDDNGAIIISLR